MLTLLNVRRKPSRKLFWLSLRLFASFASLPAQAEAQDGQVSHVQADRLPSDMAAAEPAPPLRDARERADVLGVRVALGTQELRDVRTLNREAGPTAPAKALMFAGAGVTALGVGAYLLAALSYGNPEDSRALFRVSAIAHGVGIPLALAGLGWLRRQQRKQPYRVTELQLRRELKTLRNEHQQVRREIRRLETFGPSASFDRHGARLGLRFQF